MLQLCSVRVRVEARQPGCMAYNACGMHGGQGALLQAAELVPVVLPHARSTGGRVAVGAMAHVAAKPVSNEQIPVLVGLTPLCRDLGLCMHTPLSGQMTTEKAAVCIDQHIRLTHRLGHIYAPCTLAAS